MNQINQIAQNSCVKHALASFGERQQDFEDLIISIQQIPSPTFSEKEKADFIEAKFAAMGLHDVSQDSLHNVFGRLPGRSPTSGNPIVLSAHSDTVFPTETDLLVQRRGSRLFGPGIGDNSAGVGGILLLAQTLKEFDLRPLADIWFVCNVGEEGLGDLRGMREVVQRFGKSLTYIIVEGGSYGQIMHEAIGVSRFRVKIKTDGGHSWGSFGRPSAIHELGHVVSALDNMSVPSKPRTTYNIGVVKGGTSINTIAASATLLLDLRSENSSELSRLVERFTDIIADRQSVARRTGKDISFHVTQVGARPAGHIPRKDPIVQIAREALQFVGCSAITFVAGSTDANIPLSMGLQSVCIGLTYSGNSHRQDEYIEPEYLPYGMQQLLLLTLAASEL